MSWNGGADGTYFADDGAGHKNGVVINAGVFFEYRQPKVDVGNVSAYVYLPKSLFDVNAVLSIAGSTWVKGANPVVVGDTVRYQFLTAGSYDSLDNRYPQYLTVTIRSVAVLTSGTSVPITLQASAPGAKSPTASNATKTVS